MDNKSKVLQLRNSKRLATGLFLLMASIYVLMVYLSKNYAFPWIGYVRSFSEAAMVGALADWFAVTALFHHPLGLPIPHTNIIEKSKQKIGDNLGDFVVQNFLTAENIRPYVQKVSITGYLIQFLEKDKNKTLLINEVKLILQDLIQQADDQTIARFMAQKGKLLLDEVQLNKIVAQALKYFIDKKEHENIITLLAEKIKNYIRENEDMVRDRVKEESYFFIPKFLDKKLAEKIANGLMHYFEEIEMDKNHRVRMDISEQLYKFLIDFQTNPKWENELQSLKSNLLSDEQLGKYAMDIWMNLKNMLVKELNNPISGLLLYFSKTIDEMVANLKNDLELQEKINHWTRHNAYKLILRNTQNAGTLISNTIGKWEGKALSEKLELEVGKDLQFIRINGTIVGGLVGLAIYTITSLF